MAHSRDHAIQEAARVWANYWLSSTETVEIQESAA